MLVDLSKKEIKVIMASLMNDDESPEARAAFDDFWKSQDLSDVLHDSD